MIVYALGMAAFTIVMGNAFAAFPIMTAAIGWPVLVERFGAHPAPLFAIGMLAGYCGTLCTPMAANFNLVPPALLEMQRRTDQGADTDGDRALRRQRRLYVGVAVHLIRR